MRQVTTFGIQSRLNTSWIRILFDASYYFSSSRRLLPQHTNVIFLSKYRTNQRIILVQSNPITFLTVSEFKKIKVPEYSAARLADTQGLFSFVKVFQISVSYRELYFTSVHQLAASQTARSETSLKIS